MQPDVEQPCLNLPRCKKLVLWVLPYAIQPDVFVHVEQEVLFAPNCEVKKLHTNLLRSAPAESIVTREYVFVKMITNFFPSKKEFWLNLKRMLFELFPCQCLIDSDRVSNWKRISDRRREWPGAFVCAYKRTVTGNRSDYKDFMFLPAIRRIVCVESCSLSFMAYFVIVCARVCVLHRTNKVSVAAFFVHLISICSNLFVPKQSVDSGASK